jgi:hypothetical protein
MADGALSSSELIDRILIASCGFVLCMSINQITLFIRKINTARFLPNADDNVARKVRHMNYAGLIQAFGQCILTLAYLSAQCSGKSRSSVTIGEAVSTTGFQMGANGSYLFLLFRARLVYPFERDSLHIVEGFCFALIIAFILVDGVYTAQSMAAVTCDAVTGCHPRWFPEELFTLVGIDVVLMVLLCWRFGWPLWKNAKIQKSSIKGGSNSGAPSLSSLAIRNSQLAILLVSWRAFALVSGCFQVFAPLFQLFLVIDAGLGMYVARISLKPSRGSFWQMKPTDEFEVGREKNSTLAGGKKSRDGGGRESSVNRGSLNESSLNSSPNAQELL